MEANHGVVCGVCMTSRETTQVWFELGMQDEAVCEGHLIATSHIACLLQLAPQLWIGLLLMQWSFVVSWQNPNMHLQAIQPTCVARFSHLCERLLSKRDNYRGKNAAQWAV